MNFLDQIKHLQLKDSTYFVDYIQKEIRPNSTIVKVNETDLYFDVYVKGSCFVQIYSFFKLLKTVDVNEVYSNQAKIVAEIFATEYPHVEEVEPVEEIEQEKEIEKLWSKNNVGTWHYTVASLHGKNVPNCRLDARSKPMFLTGKLFEKPSMNEKVCKVCTKYFNSLGGVQL